MSLSSQVFEHSNLYTIGVEEEYMLCCPKTGDLIDKAKQILDLIPTKKEGRYSYELIHSEIEVNTPICSTVSESIKEISNLRKEVKDIGKELGFRIGISGTHPTAKPKEQTFVDSEDYKWVKEQMQYYANQNITFGMHVHIAVSNAETAVHVCNSLRRWIPALLAISTNSPFFCGENTGMRSSRTLQFENFPRTNTPITFKSFDDYKRIVDNLYLTKSIEKSRQIWWKIRPHLDFGTIEFRICDAQRSLRNMEMLIALSQALVYQSVKEFRSKILRENLNIEYINDAIWKAIRFGFDAQIIDSCTDMNLTLEEFIIMMSDYCNPALEYFNNTQVLNQISNVLKNGTEYNQQIEICKTFGMNSLKHFLMDSVEYD